MWKRMIEIRKCSHCKNIFVSRGSPICPNCVGEDEIILNKLKNYLSLHPEANTIQISKDTGIPKQKIIEFSKENLITSKVISYKCEFCKRTIHSGRLCTRCKEKLNALKLA
jgi:hypothetical protein